MPQYECGKALCYQNADVADGLLALICKRTLGFANLELKKIVFYASDNLGLPISKIIFLCIKLSIS